MSSNILFLWLIAILTLSTTSESRNGMGRRACHPNDLKGLTSFKQGIASDDSGRLKTWIGHDCCKWDGISCDNITGRVIQLELSGSIPVDYSKYIFGVGTMTGLLSPSITLLTSLEVIDLSEERYLEGTIPPSIGIALPRLRKLLLNANKLSGQIPSSIGRLSYLEELDLSINMIQGPIPHGISCLRHLKHLILAQNELTGKIPEAFLKLTNLTELNLSGNYLEGEIPQGAPLTNFHREDYLGNRKLCGKPLNPCRP